MFSCICLVNWYGLGSADKHIAADVTLCKYRCKQFALGILYKSSLKLFFKFLRFLIVRQQRNGLDVYEPCCHFKKIGSVLKILVFELMDILQILLQQQRYLYIVDIQFVLGYEVEQQIQRSLKHIQLELC